MSRGVKKTCPPLSKPFQKCYNHASMSASFFDIKQQNKALEKDLQAAISETVDSGRYILGENVSSFEKEFADYCGTGFAVGVASGTDALHLALKACGIKPGDEVITSPFTFVATIEAIVYCGATPVFADLDAKTFNLDPDQIEEKITSKTRAVLPVHLYGLACEMDQLMAIAKKHNLAVIEDCAQATGSEFDHKKVGSFGLGCFSFFPTKNLGCFGDGGIITANNENIAKELKVLRNHGSRETYHHNIIGFNSRLDELQAAILRVKLPRLEKYLDARRANAETYSQELGSISQIILPSAPAKAKHTYNQFTVRAKDRDKLASFLKNKGIGCMIYYPVSLHLQEAFSYLGHKKGDFPESEAAQKEVLSLPVYPELTEAESAEIASAIKEFYKN